MTFCALSSAKGMDIKMKVLMLEWDSFGQEYIMQEFCQAGCVVDIYNWPFGTQDMRENKSLCGQLIQQIEDKTVSFVFSLNFFPVAAEACYLCGVKYVSWIYDTPYLLLYSKHIRYDTNMVCFFDKSLYHNFQKQNLNNIFYLPLAAPVKTYDEICITDEDGGYQGEVSFVGSTYQEQGQDFYSLLQTVDAYTRGYLEAIMRMQKEVYGEFLLEKLLDEPIVKELRRVCPIERGEDEWESEAWIYANYFLARKVTGEQRVETLRMLSERFRVKLYTPEATPLLAQVQNCGSVDYITQMPKVFKQSKINLNMTLRSIESGIPLRAMDIMGCGGFLLTNYQQDFEDYFEAGVDYVYYTDNNDLLYKVDYYLSHPQERETIAENGYQKVKEYHTYGHRIKEILQYI